MGWTLLPSVVALAASALVLVVTGSRLAGVADVLSERTGLGDAVAGALLLGAVTSLPGIVTTIVGASEGDAAFALANPVGGVAVQTVWLAVADLAYRRANLEHAAASIENVMQTLVLVSLLAIPVVAYATPELAWGWVHPGSLLIPVVYAYGLVLLRQMRAHPMWRPTATSDTRTRDRLAAAEEDDDEAPAPGAGTVGTTTDPRSTRRLWLELAGLAAVVGVVGWVIGAAGVTLVRTTGLPSEVVGFTFTTAITSLPELVVLIAAVRMGALTLGVGNVIGGNVFDTLMIFVADVAYRDGSVYAAAGPASLVLLGGTILLVALLAGGLVVRQRRGVGFEGVGLPVVYAATVALAAVAAT